MKKGILLLGMIVFTVGIVFFRDMDANTILIKQQIRGEGLSHNTESLQREEETTEMASSEEEPPLDVTIQAQEEHAGNITFLQLSMEEQRVYTEILSSLLGLEKETTLSTKDKNQIEKAFACVMLDHPEIFYVDGYKYTEYSRDGAVDRIIFKGNYLYTIHEIEARKARIEEKADAILVSVPDTDDEYEKVKYIYETIIQNTEYDTTAEDNQNICSVFLNGASVCQGYAKSVQYLLRRMGMNAGLVVGTVRSGDGHAWNLVQVNGAWYYLDATWGDAYYLFEQEDTDMQPKAAAINYDYFCVTTEQMAKTHVADMPVALPECTLMTDNYYVREGLYFTEYDQTRIQELFTQAVRNEKETVTIKCADEQVYEKVCEELLDNQKVFTFMNTQEAVVAYTNNKEQGSITFWL